MKLSNLIFLKFVYQNTKVKHCENLIIYCGPKLKNNESFQHLIELENSRTKLYGPYIIFKRVQFTFLGELNFITLLVFHF